jgi:hypothetical protein
MGDQRVARPLHTHRINAHRHPCLEWDSNPRSQRPNERTQFMPQTARSLSSAINIHVEWKYNCPYFLALVLVGGEWSASNATRLPPGKRTCGTHWCTESKAGRRGEGKQEL